MTTQQPINKAIFPDMPRQIPIVDKNGKMNDLWVLFFDSLVLALQTYYKNEGILVPPLSAANIALLTGNQSFNNIVYDSTNNEFKGNIAGTWKTFTLT